MFRTFCIRSNTNLTMNHVNKIHIHSRTLRHLCGGWHETHTKISIEKHWCVNKLHFARNVVWVHQPSLPVLFELWVSESSLVFFSLSRSPSLSLSARMSVCEYWIYRCVCVTVFQCCVLCFYLFFFHIAFDVLCMSHLYIRWSECVRLIRFQCCSYN